MKQKICMILAVGMLLPMFTGCAKEQPRETLPEIPLSTETQEMAQKKAKEAYEIPERFTGEWTGLEDTFTVKADAEILLPEDMGKLCTAKVKRHAFTQEEADKFMEVFLKGNPLYQNIYATKESVQEDIEHYEAIARGEIPYEHDGTIDRVPEIIESRKELLEIVPHEGEKIPADSKFHPRQLPHGAVNYGGNPDYREITGYAEVDGRKIQCMIRNSGGDGEEDVRFWEEAYGNTMGPYVSGDPGDTWNFSQSAPMDGQEGFLKVGDALMAELGLTQYTCNVIIPITYADGEQYLPTGETGALLEYVRKVNGLPLTKTNFSGGASEDGALEGSWWYEGVQIYVMGDRVVYFHMINPYEVTDIQSAGQLMDFQQIQEVFGKMIFMKNHYWLEANKVNGFDVIHDVNIDKVQLTLMRIRPKDNVTEGTIIPVWDFWGSEIGRAGDKEHESLVHSEERYGVQLTLNALNGTLVDREIGY